MKDLHEPEARFDDIDRIVEALLENPDRASDIKELLRRKLIAPEVVRVAHATAEVARIDEVDEFWDNVPV